MVSFSVFYFSAYGHLQTQFHSKVLDWNTSSTLDLLKDSVFGFNIMPTAQEMRIKDMYELIAQTKEVDILGGGNIKRNELGYEPRFFMFNNTRMQFPSIKFTAADPVIRAGDEQFCIHYYWERLTNLGEIRYEMFNDVDFQPECLGTPEKSKYIWKDSQPSSGMSFRLWHSYTKAGCKGDSDCEADCASKKGVLDAIGTCYAYKMLNKLCIEVGDF